MTPWQILGVDPAAAPRDVKRAYATLIKQYRPDTHPADFARIREAYEIALRHAEWRAANEVEEEDDDDAAREADPSDGARDALDACDPGDAGEAGDARDAGRAAGANEEGEAPSMRPSADEADRGPSRGAGPEGARTAEASAPIPEPVAGMSSAPAPAPAPSSPSPSPAPSSAPAPSPSAAPAPAPAPRPAPPPEPTPSRPPTPLEQVRALHETWQHEGETVALERLQSLLEASRRGPIDERQDLEVALLQWFFGVEAPPQRLLFQAGRAFDWHRHDHVLRDVLGPERLQRLGLMLAASRDHAFGRASANPWLRQVLSPEAEAAPPWFGALAQVVQARAWVSQWLARCRAASLAVGPELMSITVWRRMDRLLLLSTDLLFGLFIAMFSLPAVLMDDGAWLDSLLLPAGLMAGTVLVSVTGRFAMRWVLSRPRVEALYQRWSRWPLRHHATGVFIVAYAIAIVATAANLDDDLTRYAFFALGGLAVATVMIAMLVVLWRLVGTMECRFAAWWFERRDSLDRLAFQALLGDSRPPVVLPHRRFADRASRRAAGALALQERTRGERPQPIAMPLIRFRPDAPPAVKPPASAAKPSGKGSAMSWLRWGFFALWICAQAVHIFGSR